MVSPLAQLFKPKEMGMGLVLSSLDHVNLFMHNEEIISNFQSQVDLVNNYIRLLEEKLKVSGDECENLRFRLYECENTVLNERAAHEVESGTESGIKASPNVATIMSLKRCATELAADEYHFGIYNMVPLTPFAYLGKQMEGKMQKTRLPSTSADATQWDKPARPAAIDIEVGRRGGSTVALDATAQAMQRAKKDPPANLTERIEQLTQENGGL
ncbi:hypothetical protein V493_03670 [Pseudogymnoascus sp. VKM F-4281 (FW-2241)]|nr:hypothetical protein V493_03670 [Pseudogymnoascus sp. VKM F-4281 (FW-2241)]